MSPEVKELKKKNLEEEPPKPPKNGVLSYDSNNPLQKPDINNPANRELKDRAIEACSLMGQGLTPKKDQIQTAMGILQENVDIGYSHLQTNKAISAWMDPEWRLEHNHPAIVYSIMFFRPRDKPAQCPVAQHLLVERGIAEAAEVKKATENRDALSEGCDKYEYFRSTGKKKSGFRQVFVEVEGDDHDTVNERKNMLKGQLVQYQEGEKMKQEVS